MTSKATNLHHNLCSSLQIPTAHIPALKFEVVGINRYEDKTNKCV